MKMFRAKITNKMIIDFDFEDILQPAPFFSYRELVIPWLLAGNKPKILKKREGGRKK